MTANCRMTAFADEISPNLETQLEVLRKTGVLGLDLRRIEGINVLNLGDDQLRELRSRCDAAGVRVHSVGSPVNKVHYSEEGRAKELEKLRRAIEIAHIVGVRRIRIFSPETPLDRHEALAGAVLDWMGEQHELGIREDVVLLHENDGLFWGAYPNNAKRLFEAFGSEHFRAIFDFANAVLIGLRPWDDWFPWILPHLDTLHIKDAIEATRQVVPAGQGDGQMPRTLRFLGDEGWDGPLTLEPHLIAGGPYGGYSGEALFEVAASALRSLVGAAVA